MSEQVDSSATTDGELAHDTERESSETQKESVATHTPHEEEDTSSEQAKVRLLFYRYTYIYVLGTIYSIWLYSTGQTDRHGWEIVASFTVLRVLTPMSAEVDLQT